MNAWKQFSKDYLTFTRKERTGILCLVISIVVIYILPKFFERPASNLVKIDDNILKAIDTLQQQKLKPEYDDNDNAIAYQFEPSATSPQHGSLFEFDPNTLNEEGWQKLGLRDRTIKTINNYRTKGGRFYKPEDLQKIWGLPKGFYESVKNYISIASASHQQLYETKNVFDKPARKIDHVEINNADTTALISLPGIGSKLANRIINFRDKLGGFYSLGQVAETYGLADSNFQKAKPYLEIDATKIKKININTATKEELKMHPYVRWNLANAIIEYRNQHGAFTAIEEIKNIILIDDDLYNRLSPYLQVK